MKSSGFKYKSYPSQFCRNKGTLKMCSSEKHNESKKKKKNLLEIVKVFVDFHVHFDFAHKTNIQTPEYSYTHATKPFSRMCHNGSISFGNTQTSSTWKLKVDHKTRIIRDRVNEWRSGKNVCMCVCSNWMKAMRKKNKPKPNMIRLWCHRTYGRVIFFEFANCTL